METKRTIQMLAVMLIAFLGGLDRVTPSWGDIPPGCWPNISATQFADVDGDGRADAIKVNHDKITVRRSTGTSLAMSFGADEAWTTNPYYGYIGPYFAGTYFADVDGDGRADAIVVNENQITVRRSTGTSFGAYEPWTTNPYYGTRGTFFADVDGDGRADAIVVNENQIWVRRSTGTSFGVYEPWTTNSYYGTRGTFFADVDGDGRADAIVVNENQIWVRRSTDGSTGGSFGVYEPWTRNPYYGLRGTSDTTQFADVNGDGRADAIVVNDDAIWVRRSTGISFADYYEGWTTESYYGSVGTYFADVYGNGRADAIVVNEDKIWVRRSTGTRFGAYKPWTAEPYYGDVHPLCLN